jgi:citronellol/citronellal dehydrogenase
MSAIDRVAVVTGAARGIGLAVARRFLDDGYGVALLDIDAPTLARTAESLAPRERVLAIECDVAEPLQVQAAIDRVAARFGRIDALVNNAGGQFAAPLEAISQKGWETVVRTNLTGGFLMARECYTQWMKQAAQGGDAGAIVNIIADMWQGMPSMGHSGAARAGMLNFTETAAFEWAPVRVNAVAPGWIASSGMDQYPPEMQARIRSLPKLAPLQRMGTESEVAAAICFLLSPGAAFISGSCLRVDGAVPNAKLSRPIQNSTPNAAFNGFHLAEMPKVLR